MDMMTKLNRRQVLAGFAAIALAGKEEQAKVIALFDQKGDVAFMICDGGYGPGLLGG